VYDGRGDQFAPQLHSQQFHSSTLNTTGIFFAPHYFQRSSSRLTVSSRFRRAFQPSLSTPSPCYAVPLSRHVQRRTTMTAASYDSHPTKFYLQVRMDTIIKALRLSLSLANISATFGSFHILHVEPNAAHELAYVSSASTPKVGQWRWYSFQFHLYPAADGDGLTHHLSSRWKLCHTSFQPFRRPSGHTFHIGSRTCISINSSGSLKLSVVFLRIMFSGSYSVT
jgi:hypothetical protein